MESWELAQLVTEVAHDKKGTKPTILNLDGLTIIADYFVIMSASSSLRVKGLADAIEETLKEHGVRVHHREGYKLGRWILLDYGSVIVNIFNDEERSYYNLERLWGDAKREEVDESALTGEIAEEN